MPQDNIEAMLSDCFFAVGQGVGSDKAVDYDTIVWWRQRYLTKFQFAVEVAGNSWSDDRTRVLAVSRWLGHRARHHAGDGTSVDPSAALRAAEEIETGCRMSKLRSAAESA